MKGYKGMKHDMTCRGMQYEVGRTYHVDGKIEICRNGLHFCKYLGDVFSYYEVEDGNRFFEVEAAGTIKLDDIDKKCATSDLTVIRELTELEVTHALYGDGESGYVYGDGDDCGKGDGCGCGYGCYSNFGGGWCFYFGTGYGNGDGKYNRGAIVDNMYKVSIWR